ncbi:lipid-A-disaccharide synthase [Commensalibacter papalotli (ex Botero et al. 2024)]|uniref:Lipid-A-disaccharide synthase n=1 Tax=Commensalibacter papalotli (ex Botero et al. 2024) TaxID=2972766 RepID=A0ABM9HQD6_9PROT|nr:lipid-A-disaccharide synthase [Commensalibacter papalotli (ex Botero et al. 2024)]CAI3931240.1 Lipid A disaccharide synthetase (LpxB) (PDB:5W8N) [Commensalibacter papalotli (ex Botero et al. 2024)]CAI3944405.1 Lipid A disaccharide synthetase (LpxB) (PDB:5W8N) [Commensalibacter papalotli (ex Botero et al. 2024)]
MSATTHKIWLLAGETSGDELGAKLIKALRHFNPDLKFYGVGGTKMQEQGMEILFPMQDLAVMGLVEVLPKIHMLSNRLNQAAQDIQLKQPDVVVTIDSPGFSLRLLKKIADLHIPRVHYVAPQVWAWHESRVKKFPGLWEKLLCLLPFEKSFFAKHGLDSAFVGHPILETDVHHGNGQQFRKEHQVPETAPVLLLMPGSRRSELPKLMPVFKQTLVLLKRQLHDVVAVIPTSPLAKEHVEHTVQDWPIKPIIIHDQQDKYNAYAAANAALTKSGTTTLELALAKVPMIVTYRVNPITAMIARRMIKVPYVCMLNLLANKEVVPELLQEDCNPAHLTATLLGLLTDPQKAKAQQDAFTEIMHQLSGPNDELPSRVAAKEILGMING